MQIRCYNCHRPFALSKEAVYAALEQLTQDDMGHYNAACPHCKRVNRVSKDELLRHAPEWEKHVPSESLNE
jgi:phage FluMu protein Com